jgi:periplasmic copper chaperone A
MRKLVPVRRLGAALAGAAGLLLVTALPATAHITVSSPDAEPGSFGKLVFRVPNESDSADTTKVQVKLPTDTPFASVSTKPLPGWTVEAEPVKLDAPVESHGVEITEAVTTVTWTAEKGAALPPEQFAEFEISVGPFPENVESMSFPTIQTYSDGEVARWTQPVRAGAAEPDHPAPTLELASTSHSEAVAPAAASSPAPASSEAAGTDDSTDDSVARGLAGAALALAAVALVWTIRNNRKAKG